MINGLAVRAYDGKTLRRNVCLAAYSERGFSKELTKQKVKPTDPLRRGRLPGGDPHDPLPDFGRVGKCGERQQAHLRLIRRAGEAHQGRVDAVHRRAGDQPHSEAGSAILCFHRHSRSVFQFLRLQIRIHAKAQRTPRSQSRTNPNPSSS